jgi:uncharacterized damage-inducible protein DinB
MNENAQLDEPKLQPPGAGIPFFERIAGKFLGVGLAARKASWEDCIALYRKESTRILLALEKIPSEKLQTRTLIPRLRGLEDSSRYWSIAMTIEHVTIVSEGMSRAIVELSCGRVPAGSADTAKVKPHLNSVELIAGFAQSVDEIERRLKTDVKDHASSARFKHPWFGPLTAKQWVWIIGMHQGIHRRQIQEISARL